MKRILLITALFLSIFAGNNSYAFWIWSPKTQQWKNPKYSPLATPKLQFEKAKKLFSAKDYKNAYTEFKKILVNFPDSRQAAKAQYYLGRCLEGLKKPYYAFLEYKKVVNSYPNSSRINEIIRREYKIGMYYLNRPRKKWMGIDLNDLFEHPSIEIFRQIVESAPYSDYAVKAQYKLGILYKELARYDEAKDAFQQLIENYPESEWAPAAKYQLALCTAKAAPGVAYDASLTKEAIQEFREFVAKHPDAKLSKEAEKQMAQLRNKEAKKSFDIAEFYEGQDLHKSALIYYKFVRDNYPRSKWAALAIDKIKEVQRLISGNLTKKELLKKQKQAKKEAAWAKKKRLREEKINAKKEARQKALQRKKQIKEQRRQRKLKQIEQARKRKELARKKALQKKAAARALREQVRKMKAEKRKEKLKKKEEAAQPKQKEESVAEEAGESHQTQKQQEDAVSSEGENAGQKQNGQLLQEETSSVENTSLEGGSSKEEIIEKLHRQWQKEHLQKEKAAEETKSVVQEKK